MGKAAGEVDLRSPHRKPDIAGESIKQHTSLPLYSTNVVSKIIHTMKCY